MSPGAAFVGGALALALVFAFLPGIDLWAAGWFYNRGAGFVGSGPGLARALEVLVDVLRWFAIVLPVLILARWAIGGPLPAWAPAGVAGRYLATLILGPGLLVNLVLKDQWGRPRPGQVQEFGGLLDFRPAFEVSYECWRNCSFVAGHAAFVFAFYAIVLALPGPTARRLGILIVTAAGAVFGLGRMAQGAHFLSDVVFAGVFTFAVAWLVDRAAHRLPPVTPYDIWHQIRRGRLILRVYLGRLASAIAWRERVVGPETRRAVALLALAFLLALCLGWLDRAVALWLKQYDASGLTAVFRFLTQFGEALPYYIIFAIAGIAYSWMAAQQTDWERKTALRRNAQRAGFLFWSLAAAGIAAQLLKFGLGRARPRAFFADGSYGFAPLNFSADWTSMPSGHTINAVAIALALTMLWRPAWPAALAFALIIGLSRIVTTVHFTGDVIVGALVAIVAVRYVRHLYETAGADIFDKRSKWGISA